MIKALAFDLDNTLLDRSKRIGPATRAALDAWLSAGGVVFLATSRPLRSVRQYIPQELLSRCTLITLNGSISHAPGEAPRAHGTIGEAARAILGHAGLARRVQFFVELEGLGFGSNIVQSDEELWHLHGATRDMLIPLEALDFSVVAKVAIDGLGTDLREHLEWFEGLGVRAIPEANHTFVNVVASGIDKAAALRVRLEQLGLESHELMAFGDDLPDLGMLGLSGYAVAMGNAVDAVKQVAHHIIGDCDQDPIGPFLAAVLPSGAA